MVLCRTDSVRTPMAYTLARCSVPYGALCTCRDFCPTPNQIVLQLRKTNQQLNVTPDLPHGPLATDWNQICPVTVAPRVIVSSPSSFSPESHKQLRAISKVCRSYLVGGR